MLKSTTTIYVNLIQIGSYPRCSSDGKKNLKYFFSTMTTFEEEETTHDAYLWSNMNQ